MDYISLISLIAYCIPTNAMPNAIRLLIFGFRFIGFGWAMISLVSYKYYRIRNIWIIIGMSCVAIFATLINFTGLYKTVLLALKIFTPAVLTLNLISESFYYAIRVIGNIFFFLMLWQGYSLLTHEFGYSDRSIHSVNRYTYLFGLRVDFSEFFIFAVSITMLMAYYGSYIEKLKFIATAVVGTYFVYEERVSTGIMTIAIFVLFLLVSLMIRNEELWRSVFVISTIATIGFVIVYVGSDAFSWLLDNLLNEGVDLNGRTALWQKAIGYMHGWHWIFGNGYDHSYIFGFAGTMVSTAHSQYVNILFDFGVIGIILYFVFLWRMMSSAYHTNNDNTWLKRIVFASLFSVLITGIPTTFFESSYMYIFFIIITEYCDNDIVHNEVLFDESRRIIIKIGGHSGKYSKQ